MTDHLCIVKQYGCSCAPGECSVEKPITPAPLILISLKTQAIVCLFVAVVAGIAAFATAARMEPNMKLNDLLAQESRHG